MDKARILVLVICITMIVAFFPSTGFALDPICVSLKATANDTVGRSLESSIRSKIIRDTSIADTEETSPTCLIISLVTLKPDNASVYTMYSVSYLLRYMYTDFYITSSVGYVGSQRVPGVAQSLIDDGIVELDRILKSDNPELAAAVNGISDYWEQRSSRSGSRR